MDKITGDRHPLRKIRSRQDIMTYIKQRYLWDYIIIDIF